MVFKMFYNVYSKEELEKPMVLKPCYMIIDKDGDFVDACSGKLPASTLTQALQRVVETYPENAPFRIVKWDGRDFREVIAVS